MKTKYKPEDTATSNPNQGNQNAPGCLITYRRINKQTRSKKSKRHKEQQVIKYGHTISKYEWTISKYEWVISKYARISDQYARISDQNEQIQSKKRTWVSRICLLNCHLLIIRSYLLIIRSYVLDKMLSLTSARPFSGTKQTKNEVLSDACGGGCTVRTWPSQTLTLRYPHGKLPRSARRWMS